MQDDSHAIGEDLGARRFDGGTGRQVWYFLQEDGFIDRSKSSLHRPRLEPCNGGIV